MASAEASPALIAIVGSTGTGKSDLSLELAERIAARGGRAEIVNADAMQLYRGMDIGTAKLPEDRRRGIPHHLLDVLDVVDDASVAWYQPRARAIIEDIRGRGAVPILVGGSGLYVSSVVFDFAFPPRDPAVRARLESELLQHGPGPLHARLHAVAPDTAGRIDPANGRRVVRALEVFELAEREGGARGHGGALPESPVFWRPTRILALHTPRATLVERLDRRVERMWRDGLVGEVEALIQAGIERGGTASRAIGYAQALGRLRGELTQDEAVQQTQQLTRRYARRQVSWFRRYPGAAWLDTDTDTDEEAGPAPPLIERAVATLD